MLFESCGLIAGLIGIVLAIFAVTDWPVYTRAVVGDYPDPGRPGYLKGTVVTLPELIAKGSLACILIGFALYVLIRQIGQARARCVR